MAMAMSGGNGGGHRFARRYRRPRLVSEINVTPMVDVMLVLLVVFMITAPLLTVGVPVDLPKTAASRMVGQDEPLVITVDAEGRLYLQDTEVTIDQLTPRLAAITEAKRDTRIFLRGDNAIAYGRVMEVMGRMNVAGFKRLALITEFPKSVAGKRRAR